MIKKLLVCPWFGDMPTWWNLYEDEIASLKSHGYDLLLDRDLEGFKQRARVTLGLEAPVVPGEGKVHDFRSCLGALYRQEIATYDWYGHTDFDVLYGHGDMFPSDEELAELDVFSDHPHYLCGPFAIYRNTRDTRELFREHPFWREFLTEPGTSGWVERDLTDVLNASGLRVKYELRHGYEHPDELRRDSEGRLYEQDKEISFYHFKRSKTWPVVQT